MMRKPPKVSSTWLIVSLQRACAVMLLCFNFLPTMPINDAKSGTKSRVKIVSCHEITIKVMKYISTRIGFLNSKSSEDITEESTSCTSPLILAIISPFRSSLKKLSESDVIFLYSWLRMSQTTPVLTGMIEADDRK